MSSSIFTFRPLPTAHCLLPSLSFPYHLNRIQIAQTTFSALLQFCFQLCGSTHLKILIINGQRNRRKCNSAIHRLESLPEQVLVVVNTSPPFTIKGVGDVKLRLRIRLGRISALPFVSRCPKLFTIKKRQGGVEFRLVHLVRAGGDLCAGGHFPKAARLRRVKPNN